MEKVELHGNNTEKNSTEKSESSIWVEKKTKGYTWGLKLYTKEGYTLDDLMNDIMRLEAKLYEQYGEKTD